ncbi:UDP-glucuronosyltransferase [Paenibacillus sinopodophylli]|uniref:UDP-glucuronosyltransferase n=1 Tax=Paenibacillus sinopodophylli TaxID=1837342 RepID=UPI00110D2204|nr:UDP-glucuronosyltransferase [Paenibacillus sinopodophylli]
MGNRKVTILCSGFGLGFYIPGLILDYQLNKREVETEVLVFENYITEDKKNKINGSRQTYHANFKAALLSARMPSDIRDSLALDEVAGLIEQWKLEKRQHFIVLSGHWVYLLDQLRAQVDYSLNVHLLYVDSDRSPSWSSLLKYNPDYVQHYREVWLYDSNKQQLNYRIDVSEQPIIPYLERSDRYVIHGGGWGMGTYQGKIPELQEAGLQLDVVAYELHETNVNAPNIRYYMNDPAWNAWSRGENGGHQLPPFSEITAGVEPHYTSKLEHHRLYDVIKGARGVISKPGAGSLMDALSSATPIILLDAFGKHEQRNAGLWLAYGLGITYEDWQKSGYSTEMLEPIHHKLIQQKKVCKNYTDYFMEETYG